MRCHHKQESLSNKHACENYLRHNFKSMVLWTSYVSPSEIMEDKFLIDHNLIMLLRKGHTAHYCIYHCMYSTNELLASYRYSCASNHVNAWRWLLYHANASTEQHTSNLLHAPPGIQPCKC